MTTQTRTAEASQSSQTSAPETAVPVTVSNFIRAETDLYFSRAPLGKFEHWREMTPLDDQKIIRMNRDTLYSSAVFDLDAAAVTITLPDPARAPANAARVILRSGKGELACLTLGGRGHWRDQCGGHGHKAIAVTAALVLSMRRNATWWTRRSHGGLASAVPIFLVLATAT